jgi:hypothetical protein
MDLADAGIMAGAVTVGLALIKLMEKVVNALSRRNGNGKSSTNPGATAPYPCVDRSAATAEQTGLLRQLVANGEKQIEKTELVKDAVHDLKMEFAELRGELRGRRDTGGA